MRKVIHLFVLSLVVLLVVACQPPQDVEREIAALKEVDERFAEAFNNEDVDAIMERYWKSPDLVAYHPFDMEIRGFDALRELWVGLFSDGEVNSFEMLNLQYRVSGDVAFSWGRWKLNYQPTDQPEMEWEGRVTAMYVEEGEKWYVAVEHASVPLPLSAPAGTKAAKK